jgi:hypothetical protein
MNKTEIYKKIDEVCRVGYAKAGCESVIINQNDLWNLGDVLKEIVERLPIKHPELRPHTHTIDPDSEEISCRSCIHRSPLDGPVYQKAVCDECSRLKNHQEGDKR